VAFSPLSDLYTLFINAYALVQFSLPVAK